MCKRATLSLALRFKLTKHESAANRLKWYGTVEVGICIVPQNVNSGGVGMPAAILLWQAAVPRIHKETLSTNGVEFRHDFACHVRS